MKDNGYKWRMLGLLTLSYFLMQGARQVFNVSLPDVKAALPGASDAQWGLVRTVFLVAYGLCVPLAGIAADVFRRKWVLVLGLALLSASLFLTGFAADYLWVLIAYGVFNGIGQCMLPASASSLIAQHHVETRSRALSIYQAGSYLGVIVPSVVAGWLCGLAADGWRNAYRLFGLCGLALAVLLVLFVRDTPPLSSGEKGSGASLSEACLALVTRPSAILLAVAFGMVVFGSNGFHTFIPLFLRSAAADGGFALGAGTAAFHGEFWFCTGSFSGIALGAWLSDRFAGKRPAARLAVMATGLLVAAAAMPAMVHMPCLALCCAAMLVFGFGQGLFDCSLFAGLFEVVAPRYRSSATGEYLCFAFLIGCPATVVLGYVGSRFGYRLGLSLFGGAYAAGAVAILVAKAFFFNRDHARALSDAA